MYWCWKDSKNISGETARVTIESTICKHNINMYTFLKPLVNIHFVNIVNWHARTLRILSLMYSVSDVKMCSIFHKFPQICGWAFIIFHPDKQHTHWNWFFSPFHLAARAQESEEVVAYELPVVTYLYDRWRRHPAPGCGQVRQQVPGYIYNFQYGVNVGKFCVSWSSFGLSSETGEEFQSI